MAQKSVDQDRPTILASRLGRTEQDEHRRGGYDLPALFETTTLGTLTLKNRFVRSATWEGMAADDGSCPPALIDAIAELAKGEVGLIISSHAIVSAEGRSSGWQVAVYDDRFIDGLARMARAAHDHGSKILLQLGHAGIRTPTALTGQDALGPSMPVNPCDGPVRAMTLDEIERTIQAFVDAAHRARSAGYDGVQVHVAHGYLLSQFVSPHYNRRTDQYGGTTENRARIVLQILERIRGSLGEDFHLQVKLNSEDFIDNGLTVTEMLRLADLFAQTGIDAIEMSGGVTDPHGDEFPVREGLPQGDEDEVYYREAARRFKEQIDVPLILVGGIRSYEVAKELVDEQVADYIALCRPLMCEPHLIARWKSGDTRKSLCDSCVECLPRIRRGEGLCCVVTKVVHGKPVPSG